MLDKLKMMMTTDSELRTYMNMFVPTFIKDSNSFYNIFAVIDGNSSPHFAYRTGEWERSGLGQLEYVYRVNIIEVGADWLLDVVMKQKHKVQ